MLDTPSALSVRSALIYLPQPTLLPAPRPLILKPRTMNAIPKVGPYTRGGASRRLPEILKCERSRSVLKSSKSCFAGPDDGLGPVGDLQLGEDVRDVVAYGLGAQRQLFRDGGIWMALGDEVQDLTLPVGEGRKGLGWGWHG